MVFTPIHHHFLRVAQVVEVLVADGKVGIFGVARHHHDFGSATLLINDAGDGVVSTWIFVNRGEEALGQYLYIDGIAHGNHLVGLAALVVTVVFHLVVRHVVAIGINACHIDFLNLGDGQAVGAAQLHVERVETLKQPCAYPVEVHQLAVGMAVQMESG